MHQLVLGPQLLFELYPISFNILHGSIWIGRVRLFAGYLAIWRSLIRLFALAVTFEMKNIIT